MFVEGGSWRPDPEPPPEPEPRRSLPHVPWPPFAWFALFCWVLVGAAELGGVLGYGVVLLAVGLGSWGLNRYAARWEWGSAGDSGAWR